MSSLAPWLPPVIDFSHKDAGNHPRTQAEQLIHTILHLRSQPTSPTPIPLSIIAPVAGITAGGSTAPSS